MSMIEAPSRDLPKGWTVARNPDGTPCIALPRGAGASLHASDFLGPTGATHGTADLVLSLLWLLFVLVLGLLWRLFGREEWRVGPDLLELREAFMGRCSEERYAGATLAIVEQVFGRWALIVEAPGARRLLLTGRPAPVRALGDFLAEQTGWLLCLPPFGGEQ